MKYLFIILVSSIFFSCSEKEKESKSLELSTSDSSLSLEGKRILADTNGVSPICTTFVVEKNISITSLQKLLSKSRYGHLSPSGNKNNYLGRINRLYRNFISVRDTLVVVCNYNDIKFYRNRKYLIVESMGKKGVIDRNGNTIIPIRYKDINFLGENNKLFSVNNSKNFGVINNKNEIVIPFNYGRIFWITNDFICLRDKKGNEGYIDTNNIVIIPFEYKTLPSFREYKFGFAKKNGKRGLIDFKGELLTDFKFDNCYTFDKNKSDTSVFGGIMTNVIVNGKWGVIDSKGNEIIEIKYDSKIPIQFPAATIKQDKWAILDIKGEQIISETFDDVKYVNRYISNKIYRGGYGDSSLIGIKKNNHWGLINTHGEIITPCEYDKLDSYGNYYLVENESKFGILNKKGSVIIPLDYDSIGYCYEQTFPVNKSGKWGVVDKSDSLILDIKYDGAKGFVNNLCAVKQNNKWGFVDWNDKIIIPFIYEDVKSFYTGDIATVKKNGKWGVIDVNGKVFEPFLSNTPIENECDIEPEEEF